MSAVGVLVSFCEKHGPQSVLTTQAYGANASAAGAAEVPSVSTCDRDRDYSHSLAEQLEGLAFALNNGDGNSSRSAGVGSGSSTNSKSVVAGPAVGTNHHHHHQARPQYPGSRTSSVTSADSSSGLSSRVHSPTGITGADPDAGMAIAARGFVADNGDGAAGAASASSAPPQPPLLSATPCPAIPSSTHNTASASSCRECHWPGFELPVVSWDPLSSTIYRSTQVPQRAELYALVRQVCVRALSCEVSPGQENPILFGNAAQGFALSMAFYLTDRSARGQRRQYAIVMLSADRLQLLHSWKFLVAGLARMISHLKTSAAEAAEAADARTAHPPSPKLAKTGAGDNSKNSSGGGGGGGDRVDGATVGERLRLAPGVMRRRADSTGIAQSLGELTGIGPSLPAWLHAQFVWLVEGCNSRMLERQLEGPSLLGNPEVLPPASFLPPPPPPPLSSPHLPHQDNISIQSGSSSSSSRSSSMRRRRQSTSSISSTAQRETDAFFDAVPAVVAPKIEDVAWHAKQSMMEGHITKEEYVHILQVTMICEDADQGCGGGGGGGGGGDDHDGDGDASASNVVLLAPAEVPLFTGPRALAAFLKPSHFALLVYTISVGNQCIVRSDHPQWTRSFVEAVLPLLPAGCVSVQVGQSEYQPSFAASILGLLPRVELPEYLDAGTHLLVDLVVHPPTAPSYPPSKGGGGEGGGESSRRRRGRPKYRYSAHFTGGSLLEAAHSNSYVADILRYMHPDNSLVHADEAWLACLRERWMHMAKVHFRLSRTAIDGIDDGVEKDAAVAEILGVQVEDCIVLRFFGAALSRPHRRVLLAGGSRGNP